MHYSGAPSQRSNPSKRTRTAPVALAVLASAGLAAGSAAPAQADLAPGSWVLDGSVEAIEPAADGGAFVGGGFRSVRQPTGGGLILSATGTGAVDPKTFPAVAGTVRAVTGDGAGGWFIAGEFSHVGGVPLNGVAHILGNGSVDPTWAPRVDATLVETLAFADGVVYAAGRFDSVDGLTRNGLAAIDGRTGRATPWNPAPTTGVVDEPAKVTALQVVGQQVYVGGRFTRIGGQARRSLAVVSTSTAQASGWNPDLRGSDPFVGSIAVVGTDVYVVGAFDRVGALAARRDVAAIDSRTGFATLWTPPAFDGPITRVVADAGTVYLAGFFTKAGTTPRKYLAALEARNAGVTAWDPNPTGVVSDVALAGDTVYVAGILDRIGGQERHGAAAVDATSGSARPWNPQPADYVGSIRVAGGRAFIGGSFSGAGPDLAPGTRFAARVLPNGTLDTDWRPAINGQGVESLARDGARLYLGGTFGSVNGKARQNLAAVSTDSAAVENWAPGADSTVYALAVHPGGVVAGGAFSTLDGKSRKRLGGLDAATGAVAPWVADADGDVEQLAIVGNSVFAAGGFGTLGGAPRSRVGAVDVRDGRTLPFDPAPDGDLEVEALTPHAGRVFVGGGAFRTIGRRAQRGSASLDPVTGDANGWNPGTSDGVDAIAGSGDVVYLGGNLETVGGQARGRLAAVGAATGTLLPWAPNVAGGFGLRSVRTLGTNVALGGNFGAVDGRITGPFAIVPGATGSGSNGGGGSGGGGGNGGAGATANGGSGAAAAPVTPAPAPTPAPTSKPAPAPVPATPAVASANGAADPVARAASLLGRPASAVKRLTVFSDELGALYGPRSASQRRIARLSPATRLPLVTATDEARVAYRLRAIPRRGRSVAWTTSAKKVPAGLQRVSVRTPAAARRVMRDGGTLRVAPVVDGFVEQAVTIRVR